jgi:hypothetical protein
MSTDAAYRLPQSIAECQRLVGLIHWWNRMVDSGVVEQDDDFRSSNYVLEHILRPSHRLALGRGSAVATDCDLPRATRPRNRLSATARLFLHPGKKERPLIFVAALRRQALVCARLAEDCDDRHLAERFEIMALNLMCKADEFEELPARLVHTKNCVSFQQSSKEWAGCGP